jgi:hypothetical protein
LHNFSTCSRGGPKSGVKAQSYNSIRYVPVKLPHLVRAAARKRPLNHAWKNWNSSWPPRAESMLGLYKKITIKVLEEQVLDRDGNDNIF